MADREWQIAEFGHLLSGRSEICSSAGSIGFGPAENGGDDEGNASEIINDEDAIGKATDEPFTDEFDNPGTWA